jgi:hypothetical protein
MAAPRRVVPIARPATAPLVSPLSLLSPWTALTSCASGGRVTTDRAVDVGSADEARAIVVSTVVGKDVERLVYEVPSSLYIIDAIVTGPTTVPGVCAC